MSDHNYKSTAGDELVRFLSRAARFAEKGRLVPRLNPEVRYGEVRRLAGRLRRHEVPPPYPDWTHEEAAEVLELSLEQEEIIRDTARDLTTGRTLYQQALDREARDRDIAAFHALKAEASRHGGDHALVRQLHRARRASGQRGRGRR